MTVLRRMVVGIAAAAVVGAAPVAPVHASEPAFMFPVKSTPVVADQGQQLPIVEEFVVLRHVSSDARIDAVVHSGPRVVADVGTCTLRDARWWRGVSCPVTVTRLAPGDSFYDLDVTVTQGDTAVAFSRVHRDVLQGHGATPTPTPTPDPTPTAEPTISPTTSADPEYVPLKLLPDEHPLLPPAIKEGEFTTYTWGFTLVGTHADRASVSATATADEGLDVTVDGCQVVGSGPYAVQCEVSLTARTTGMLTYHLNVTATHDNPDETTSGDYVRRVEAYPAD